MQQHVCGTNLQANLHPVKLCALEELGGFKGLEEALLLQVLGVTVVQSVEDIHLEQLLVANPHLDRVVGRAVLIEPIVDQWHIHRPSCPPRPATLTSFSILGLEAARSTTTCHPPHDCNAETSTSS